MSACSVRAELRQHAANQARLMAFEKEVAPMDADAYKALKNKVEYIDYCVSLLKDEDQDTIRLVFFKGMTYREYQAVKCLSKRGAEKRIARASKNIESLMVGQKQG